MSYSYVYFADGRIFRDGLEGFLAKSPTLPVTINMLSWGKDVEQFYLDVNGTRHDLNNDDLVPFVDSIIPLIAEDSFELGSFYTERSSLTSKIEATDYVEEGVLSGRFNEADYIGVINDRITWKNRLVEINDRITEINKNKIN